MKIIFMYLLFLLLVSCATTPPEKSDIKVLPPERIYIMNTSGDSEITITRDTGYVGSLCALGLYIDDELIADFNTSESLTVQVASGERELGIGPSKDAKGLCSGGLKNREFTLKPGQSKRLRIFIDGNGSTDIFPE